MRQGLARCAHVGFALGLMSVIPLALGQKMYKCPDGKGGMTFQQSPCYIPETPQEAEKRVLEGTAVEKSDGSLTPDMEKQYPGPWHDTAKADINAAFAKAKIKGCEKFRYRQRVGGGSGEFLVHCTTDGTSWVAQYFVWLASGTIKGPYKL